ncbi:tyrosine-type recombinase/integrase [Streptomyces mexicanus]|uniref:tyrosine-type recombinase/integrase n=1 Tax=Streptomyces mexicanus TaxID=178566 RepID=UPI00365D9CC2
MATSGWIEDRWLKKRPNPKTGKRERTELYGKGKRYRVAGIPGVRKRSFDTLEEAKEWKAKAIVATKKKEFVDDRAGAILLGNYIEEHWWPHRDIPVNTRGPMRSRVFNHIVDSTLGRTPMNAIGDEQLLMWKKELKDRGLAATTRQVIWNHLSSIFQSAVGTRIARNPCRAATGDARPDSPGETKARAWEQHEALAIQKAMPRRYQIVPDLGMRGGQRQAEALGFSPDDVDRDRMLLHIRRQLLWENGSTPFFKLPKGDKERSVPLSPGLLRRIDEHLAQFPPVAVTLPWNGPGNGGRPTATVRLLVTTGPGNRVNPALFNNHVMKPALAAAGLIAPREEGSNWGWEPSREMMHHRWRHTYASVQLAAGEDIISVSHWMGHASPDITFKIYAHFLPDRGMRGRTAVDAWLEAGAAALRPPAADLWTVDPLAFTESAQLKLPAEQGKDQAVEVYVRAARYVQGPWTVGAMLDASGAVAGEIRTEPGDDPDRALASALAWVKEYAAAQGLALTRAENLNGQIAEPLRPYQALGRFLLVPREGVS